jgi:hypothetical protein
MFSDPYRRAYREMAFPPRDDTHIEQLGRRDALRVLRDAADRCQEQDMRTDEVRAALDFVKRRCAYEALFERFWKALAHPDLAGRRRIAFAELRVMARQAPEFAANSRRTDY